MYLRAYTSKRRLPIQWNIGTTISYQLLVTVKLNGAAFFVEFAIMAPVNTRDRSKQGRNDGDTWKMFLGQAAAAFGIIQHDMTILHMLTNIVLTKMNYELSIVRVCRDCLICLAHFPPLSCDLQLLRPLSDLKKNGRE